MVRIGAVALAFAALLLVQAAAQGQTSWNISGTWKGVGGAAGSYEITQTATTVRWVGRSQDGKTWAHDFRGTITGDVVTGTFRDRPGFTVFQRGTVTVHVLDGCHMRFVEASTGWGTKTWTKVRCAAADLIPRPVPIASVSNGCGGAGWAALVAVQNYMGNTSVYRNSNVNPLARKYTVNFVEACNLHDAGYTGSIVVDKLRGGVKDFRKWTRRQVDDKFLADMRLICIRTIPENAAVARRNCQGTGGNASFGAVSRYNFVRRWGGLFFDADLGRPGSQQHGPRANN